jgi:glycosyltransferase involved in cell wall biosynthesis
VPDVEPADAPGAEPVPATRPIVYVDVTDALRSGWRAGIQQVVRRVVTELPGVAPDLDVVAIVHEEDPDPVGFRRASAAELASLARPNPGGPPPAPPAPPGAVRRARAAALDVLPVGGPVRRAKQRVRRRRTGLDVLRLERLEPGSVLLELDAVWNQVAVDRDELLRGLRSSGVRIVPLVHDLGPFEHPEWFVPSLVEVFEHTVAAQIDHADAVLANSASTAEGVRRLAAERGRPELDVRAVALGVEPPAASSSPLPAELEGVDYLLVVGTVEPRKGHAVALDAFDEVAATDPDLHLVVVGRAGWRADDVVARLRAAAPGGRVHWFDGMGDEQLDRVLRDAFLVLVPSVTEGYGLPLAEAISRGAPVLSSTGGALVETGRDVAEFLPPDDARAWSAAIRELRAEPAARDRLARRSAAARPPTWRDTAAAVADVLRELPARPPSARGGIR